MEMIVVGSEMKKVIDAVVENSRACTDRIVAELAEEMEAKQVAYEIVAEMREKQIAGLEFKLRCADAAADNLRRAMDMLLDTCEKQEQEINETEASLELYQTALGLLCDATFMKPEVILAAAAAELDKEEQPACCAAGHCGTDKCGGCCKDEPELDIPFTMGEYETVYGTKNETPIVAFTIVKNRVK